MPDPYDLAVIGAGPGGYNAAVSAAQLGMHTAIIEKERVGGLCLNWGCIPSKALLHAADMLNQARRGSEFGITYDNLTANLALAVDRSRTVVEKSVGGIETLLAQNGVELIRGLAQLEEPGRVRVEPGSRVIEARNVLIATGAIHRSLPGVVPNGDRVLTSREALELRQRPESIIIAGGGPIGCEFAYLYRSYGAEVTLIELLPNLLPAEDEDLSHELERSFTGQGIQVLTGSAVQRVESRGDHVAVSVLRGEALEVLRAERLLIGAGFAPAPDTLGLAHAGIETQLGWIKVDEYARTSAPGIWAAGDATGRMLLAHVAAHQGVTAVEKMAGHGPPPIDYDRMPRAVYCRPQVAALGLTEAQARERGIDVRIGRFPFRASGMAMALGETEGFIKLVIDAGSRAIVGWHIMGQGAAEMLGEATLAATLEATPAELAASVHAHPTLSEALKEAALAVTGEAIHFYSPKRP